MERAAAIPRDEEGERGGVGETHLPAPAPSLDITCEDRARVVGPDLVRCRRWNAPRALLSVSPAARGGQGHGTQQDERTQHHPSFEMGPMALVVRRPLRSRRQNEERHGVPEELYAHRHEQPAAREDVRQGETGEERDAPPGMDQRERECRHCGAGE